MTTTPKTLDELRETIEGYGPVVDTPEDQYAHNIVNLTLGIIAKEYGDTAANEAIDDYNLEAKGWRKHEEATDVKLPSS